LPTTTESEKAMKAATIVGIVLILIGIIGFVAGGFSFTHEKKDVDLGPVQVSHEQKKTVPISPILSMVALVAGVGLVVVGVRAK
jgi:preprotein translocase subunit Sss1